MPAFAALASTPPIRFPSPSPILWEFGHNDRQSALSSLILSSRSLDSKITQSEKLQAPASCRARGLSAGFLIYHNAQSTQGGNNT